MPGQHSESIESRAAAVLNFVSTRGGLVVRATEVQHQSMRYVGNFVDNGLQALYFLS
jgi:hypothetical protein